MSKQIFSHREFLNTPGYHSGAYIVSNISTDEKYLNYYAELSISDCDRKISLDLDLEDDRDFENTMYKLNTLEKGIAALREALINNDSIRKDYIKRQEEKDKS